MQSSTPLGPHQVNVLLFFFSKSFSSQFINRFGDPNREALDRMIGKDSVFDTIPILLTTINTIPVNGLARKQFRGQAPEGLWSAPVMDPPHVFRETSVTADYWIPAEKGITGLHIPLNTPMIPLEIDSKADLQPKISIPTSRIPAYIWGFHFMNQAGLGKWSQSAVRTPRSLQMAHE
jgi:hypothetical protein